MDTSDKSFDNNVCKARDNCRMPVNILEPNLGAVSSLGRVKDKKSNPRVKPFVASDSMS